jgi:hypothetical protein
VAANEAVTRSHIRVVSDVHLEAGSGYRSETDLTSISACSNDNLSCDHPLKVDDDPFGRHLPVLSRHSSRSNSSQSHARREHELYSMPDKRWAIE